jgi:uncharacterized protein (TIGR02453 family)
MKSASGTFKGFPAEGLAFLRELKKNNNREWFTPKLDQYKTAVRAPMLELVHALHVAMLGFAPAYVGEPAKCLYRIYRDTRFSKDKTPYKTRADALFWRNSLDKNSGGGFYLSISPEEVAIGGGLYMAEPAALLAVRQHIAKNAQEFRSTFETKTVRRLMGELTGDKITRVPKGFPPDHPAADLLKHKNFVLYNTLNTDIITTPKLFREIVSRMEAITPFVEFLDTPLLKGNKHGSATYR